VNISQKKIRFHSEKLLPPRPTPKLEDRPLSAVRECLLNIFAATIHMGGRSSIRNLRTRHAVVTGTHLQHGSLNHFIRLFPIIYYCSLPLFFFSFFTKGVTQCIFNPSTRKSYCLTFTGTYFHPIFYLPLPQGVQSLLQSFYAVLFVIFLQITQPPAKSLTHESMFLQISVTYTRNSSGPKTLPCSTSEVTLTSLDSCPTTLTLCVQSTRNSLTQTIILES
jgi:hypothetical protein